MEELKTFYNKLPPMTRYYYTIILITATIASYIKSLQIIIYYIFLDYSLVFKKFQIWRLFTNLLYVGGFAPQFLFFIIMTYFHFRPAEQKAIVTRSYAQFIMMVVYILLFLHIVNIISLKLFGFEPSFTLAHQIFLSFIYVDSKREPQKMVTLYFFKMKNAFFPYALIALNIVGGSGIYDNIIGIIVGNTYYVLKDVLPVSKSLHILKTPKFLVDFIEKYYYANNPVATENENNEGNQNNNNNNANRGFGFGNSGVMNRGDRGFGNNNNNANRGFRAFGGRGTTVG